MNRDHHFREGFAFDVEALERYLSGKIADFSSPLRVTQFPGGQSNPTYRLDSQNASYVLRRKPPGNLVPSAHAIEREYRVLKTQCLGPAILVEGLLAYLVEYRSNRLNALISPKSSREMEPNLVQYLLDQCTTVVDKELIRTDWRSHDTWRDRKSTRLNSSH